MTSCESHVVILEHVEPDQEIWYSIMGTILGDKKESLLELFSSLEPRFSTGVQQESLKHAKLTI